MKIELTEAFARTLDEMDALRPLREEFLFPQGREGEPVIYFAGNSLGLFTGRAVSW